MTAIERFFSVSSGSGDGSGDGSGYGSSDGSGDGSGYGYGDGSGDGSGDGYGDGYGSGSGFGSGFGSGSGSGYGSSDGSGDGSGFGYGSGVRSFNGLYVFMIDAVQTVIYRVRGNIATGAILQADLTLQPCFIAKSGDHFGHGKTAREAAEAARAKELEELSEEDRVARFVAEFNTADRYTGSDLFTAHGWLTGSCLMGREQFVKGNQIDLSATFSVTEFIAMTKNAYGGEIVRQLEGYYS